MRAERFGFAIFTLIIAGVVVPAQSQVSLDSQSSAIDQAAAGRKFAEMVCAACHVVSQQDNEIPILKVPGPSFAVLARRPTLTEQSLRDFLKSNHRSLGPAEAMPNPQLADYQIDEIVAYFMALKAKK